MALLDLNHKLSEARELLLSRDFSKAMRRYEELVRAAPQSAVVWFEYGNAASALKDLDKADQAWTRALELAPRNAELIGLIGHRYQGLRRPERAKACFAQAAAADPRAINPRISLAVLQEQNHQLSEARQAVEECFAIDPEDDQACYFSAVLDRRENQLESCERTLRDLLARDPKHPFVRYAARYELAQVLDRTDRYDEAFQKLLEAKQIVSELTRIEVLLQSYDQSSQSALRFTQAQPKDILRTWSEYFPERKRQAIPRLAFLGGHPRSGTTLLEQILDAHPEVAALDEPTAFLEVLQPAFLSSKDHSSTRLNTLREQYIQALFQELGSPQPGRLLLDKNPSPTARLPVWLRVFPELKVLIALRDPRDVVLSCFFQNIPLNAANANFLTLDRLVKHYADLMDIWLCVREWSGFQWIETRYEDTVGQLESEGKRITEFLGLTWHEDQSRFYEKSRKKQLYSPTYQDVTKPVYQRSVGRWTAYEKHLAPILPKLHSYCERFGYR